MRIATVDVGTNSTRLLVSEVSCGRVKQLFKKGVVTRLGEGVKRTGFLSREGIERTLAALKEFKGIVEEFKVDKVIVVTTEAARLAANAEDFLSRVRELGFTIEVLSDREEAELVFWANVEAFSVSKAMTVDLGGGSTEIVFGDRNGIKFLKSLKFGVVTLWEEFLRSDPPEKRELEELESFIEGKLNEVKEEIGVLNDFEVIAVGGTITSVVAMEEEMEVYDPSKVHGYRVTRSMVEKWYLLLSFMKVGERKKIVGLEENRADVIVPGLAFFKVFCDVFRKESLTVSELGLLYGLAFKEAKRVCLQEE